MSISVVVPARNRAHTLGRALQSVLSQTRAPDEILVVDDGSTDGTADVARSHEGVVCIANYRARGPAGARNTGVKEARGAYVAFLDSDDEWMPCHLGDSLEALRRFGADVSYALWYRQRGRRWEKYPDLWLDFLERDLGLGRIGDVVPLGPRIAEYSMSKPFWCFHVDTLVARRSALEACGGFVESLGTSEDLDLSFRLLHARSGVLLRAYHAKYHEGDDNLVATRAQDEGRLKRHLANSAEALRRIASAVESSDRIRDKKACLEMIQARIKDCEVLR